MLPQYTQKPSFTLPILQQTQICFCLVSEKIFAEMVQYHFLTPKKFIPEALESKCLYSSVYLRKKIFVLEK